jgi:hypothetical protein
MGRLISRLRWADLRNRGAEMSKMIRITLYMIHLLGRFTAGE